MKRISKKVELTNKRVQTFLKNAEEGQRLYDTKVAGFYIRKMKSGGFFYLNYLNSTGKTRTAKIAKFTESTITIARDKAKNLVGRVVSGEDVQETRKQEKAAAANTPRAYLDNYYRQVQAKHKSGDFTIQTILNFFPDWLDKPIIELSQVDVIKWQAKNESTGCKYVTLKRRYAAFKGMLNYAVKQKVIKENPIKNAHLKKYQETEDQRTEKRTKRSYLSAQQMKDFLAALDTYQDEKREKRRNSRTHGKPHLQDLDSVEFVDHVKPIMLLLFYTGFRPGDAIGLRWEDVNLNFSLISKVIEKTAHKNDAEWRFPISPPLLEALKKWHKQNGEPTSGLVFPSAKTGARFNRKSLLNPWNKIREIAGLPDTLELYSLRHNYASHLVMSGCNLLSVAKLLGHKDTAMVTDHYGHLQPSLLKEYSDRFAALSVSDDQPGVAHEKQS